MSSDPDAPDTPIGYRDMSIALSRYRVIAASLAFARAAFSLINKKKNDVVFFLLLVLLSSCLFVFLSSSPVSPDIRFSSVESRPFARAHPASPRPVELVGCQSESVEDVKSKPKIQEKTSDIRQQ